jgi:integrase/recombinase XerD
MSHPLEELSRDYLRRKQVSESTKKTYRIAFNHYIDYLEDEGVDYARTKDLIAYKARRIRLGDSSTWIYIQISAIKGLYTYLANNQKKKGLKKNYAYNISLAIQNKKDDYHIKKHILSPFQARKLILESKDRKHIWDYRDHAIIYLMLVSGMKAHEIIKARRSDYKIVEGVALIYLDESKSINDKAFVKLPRGAMRALNDYLVLREDNNPYLFISHRHKSKSGRISDNIFSHIFTRVLRKAGLNHLKITANCLRQTAGIINLMRGGSISQTYSLLRHKRMSSTLVYQDHLDRLKDDSEEKLEAFILNDPPLTYQFYIDIYKQSLLELIEKLYLD